MIATLRLATPALLPFEDKCREPAMNVDSRTLERIVELLSKASENVFRLESLKKTEVRSLLLGSDFDTNFPTSGFALFRNPQDSAQVLMKATWNLHTEKLLIEFPNSGIAPQEFYPCQMTGKRKTED